MKLSVTITPPKATVSISTPTVGISTGNPITRDYVDRDPYTGEYTITPGDEAVVMETKNLRMTDNVTINPIPSNYGKITWNGSTLTVS